jgi:hypothetical protein
MEIYITPNGQYAYQHDTPVNDGRFTPSLYYYESVVLLPGDYYERFKTDRHTIAAQMNADLAKGWWIWTSPNKVEHLVDNTGRCSTCGRTHQKPEGDLLPDEKDTGPRFTW